MATNDFEDIKNAVRDVAGELGNLLQSASEAIEKAKKSVDHGNVVSHSNTIRHTASGDYKNTKFMPPQLYKKTKGEDIGGKAQSLIGLGLGLGGILAVVGGVLGIAFGNPGFSSIIVGSLLAVLGVFLGAGGLKRLSLLKKFKEYLEVLGDKTYVTIGKLMERTGKSEKTVEEELQDLIQRKYFMQGHLDRERDYFITSDETFKNYEEVLAAQEKLEQAKREQDSVLREAGLSTEGIRLVRKGQEFLVSINRLNAEIPDPIMTEKLQKLETQVRRLLTEVRKQPDSAGELRKLMNYYLPTTEKLVRSYQELDQRTESAETVKTKAEIILTLDTMSSAIEKMLDKLFLNENWDVATDISVLNQVLEMEGLKEQKNELKFGNAEK
ncbi:MAG: 5-bromo-4-chloroindolyl phosphate hydrolysis family protein [Lachnospiraceae bacterium]|nr:5-bromo-4-chloroindolyl phosphate hydrolysis family protein [Lachnospiraceae bacterium]